MRNFTTWSTSGTWITMGNTRDRNHKCATKSFTGILIGLPRNSFKVKLHNFLLPSFLKIRGTIERTDSKPFSTNKILCCHVYLKLQEMRILLCIVAVNYQLLTEKTMFFYASSEALLTDYNVKHNSSIVSRDYDVSTNIPSKNLFPNHTISVDNDRNFSALETTVLKNENILEEMKRKIIYYNNLEFRIWQIVAPMLLGKWFSSIVVFFR